LQMHNLHPLKALKFPDKTDASVCDMIMIKY
jgi:hypothetical protein